jgi:hypothetical protein
VAAFSDRRCPIDPALAVVIGPPCQDDPIDLEPVVEIDRRCPDAPTDRAREMGIDRLCLDDRIVPIGRSTVPSLVPADPIDPAKEGAASSGDQATAGLIVPTGRMGRSSIPAGPTDPTGTSTGTSTTTGTTGV